LELILYLLFEKAGVLAEPEIELIVEIDLKGRGGEKGQNLEPPVSDGRIRSDHDRARGVVRYVVY
jgi:hypothetical protein